jgi:ketosteroid isomerase-like protein
VKVTDESRRQILLDYFGATVDVDLDRIGSFFTEDCVVWLVPSAVKHGLPRPLVGRDAFVDLVRTMQSDGRSWKPRAFLPQQMFFDDDTVAVHVRHIGDMPNGSVYDNEYVFICTFEGDRIAVMREFTDTAFIGDFLAENAMEASAE